MIEKVAEGDLIYEENIHGSLFYQNSQNSRKDYYARTCNRHIIQKRNKALNW